MCWGIGEGKEKDKLQKAGKREFREKADSVLAGGGNLPGRSHEELGAQLEQRSV